MQNNLIKVEMKNMVFTGVFVKQEGCNIYLKNVENGEMAKFHIDECIIIPNPELNRQIVRVGNELVVRKVYFDSKGDRTICYKNEEFLLKRNENVVLHAISSHLTTYLWELESYVHRNMHHMDKIKPNTRQLTKLRFSVLCEYYNSNKSLLDEWYEVDSKCLDDFIQYAKRTLTA